MTIEEMVEGEGWLSFRQAETEALRELIGDCRESVERSHHELSPSLIIISVGGGTITTAENRALIRSAGLLLTLWGEESLLRDRQRLRAKLYPASAHPLPIDDGEHQFAELIRSRYAAYIECDLWLETLQAESISQLATRVYQIWRVAQERLEEGGLLPCWSLPPTQTIEESRDELTLTSKVDVDSIVLHDYPIYFKCDAESDLIELIWNESQPSRERGQHKVGVLSDETLGHLHSGSFVGKLQSRGIDAHLITFPVGEPSKRLRVVEALVSELLRIGFGRGDHLVAFGGGVTGDLCGFLASIYMRGLSWSQVPTSLLAQVDSSIGAKTAVNHPLGKNLIGSFYRPLWVWVDEMYLCTLPIRQLRNGWVEALKHGLISDQGHFNDLCALAKSLSITEVTPECPLGFWRPLLEKTISIKAQIISHDERERGVRALLNLGHTIGHAIERAHSDLYHGEAVALGLSFTVDYCARYESLSHEEAWTIKHVLETAGLETDWRLRFTPRALEALQYDKKQRGDHLLFVSLSEIGHAELQMIKRTDFLIRIGQLLSEFESL